MGLTMVVVGFLTGIIIGVSIIIISIIIEKIKRRRFLRGLYTKDFKGN